MTNFYTPQQYELGAFNIQFGSPGNDNLVDLPGSNLIIAGLGFAAIDAWMGSGVFAAGVGEDAI